MSALTAISCRRTLIFEAMREAAAVLVGKHDFRNFCSMKTDVESTVRTVYSLNLEKEDDMIVMTITRRRFSI